MNTARQRTVERIWGLLPSVYRTRDEEGHRWLRQLIDVIAIEVDVLEESLDQLYDDLFIETSSDWSVPYIGELIGYRPLQGGPPEISTPRAEVANTIAYRRRKGTAAMLEQLAADVTGWKARAVEFFELLSTTQYMNHPRPGKGAVAELRYPLRLETIGGAFEDLAHLAEMRRIGTGSGRYNIHNVGIFLWRLDAIQLTGLPLAPDAGSRQRFRFHPLGIDEPLFAPGRTEDEITHIAERLDVPAPLTRRWLKAHLEQYYGESAGLAVGYAGEPAVTTIRVCDLSDIAGDWAHAPAAGSGVVALDPVLGRVYFADPVPDDRVAIATYRYGAALRIGGGGYRRVPPGADGTSRLVADGADVQVPLNQVNGGGTVQITDSWDYRQNLRVTSDPDTTVVLCSADRCRPLIIGDAPLTIAAGAGATVVIDGLMFSGGPVVIEATGDQQPRTVRITNCTLVPGLARTAANAAAHADAPSLIVSDPFAHVEIQACILGPVVAVDGSSICVTDSVIDASAMDAPAYSGAPNDAGTPGGLVDVETSTVIGQLHATEVTISNSIHLGTVTARRRQKGCVRFSYVPSGSQTPAMYRCQPGTSNVRPTFTSLRFGDPGYAQLRAHTPDGIRRGADNESEMGAGNSLFAPQREANLLVRLDEYLRFGLEAGVFYAT
jgi:hypothetical protein